MASNDYSALITSEHRDKAKFVAFVQMITSFAVDMTAPGNTSFDIDSDITMLVDSSGGFGSIGGAPAAFDLDVASGVQLDAIGERVGLARTQNVPSFGYIELGDLDYQNVLRARIKSNHWDGSMEGFQDILQSLFPGSPFTLLAIDNQDMTMDIYVVGSTPSSLQQALINSDLIVPRPEGVRINGITHVTDPLFGLDYQNTFIAGLDTGFFYTTL